MDDVKGKIDTLKASDNSQFSTLNCKLLFTAFEPSGDHLAAPVIAELKKRYPNLEIYALGGEKMQRAGAHLIENSCCKPVMLLSAVKEIFTHKARLRRMRQWIKKNKPNVIIPVDSPAANWSICKLARRYVDESKIVHLAAPQIWAWAGWRINKLKKLTDKVLCLLAFEADWFARRGVKSVFVGHPIFTSDYKENVKSSDNGDYEKQLLLKLAVLPGSRSLEIKKNWPAMLETARRLYTSGTAKQVRVFSANKKITALIISMCPDKKLPGWLELVQTDIKPISAGLSGFDIALCVSGTVTLECVAQKIAMVVFYKVNWFMWNLAGRWIIKTRTFTLPNLVAIGQNLKDSNTPGESDFPSIDRQLTAPGSKLVPELVPWFGNVDKLSTAVTSLAKDIKAREKQRQEFSAINNVYEQKNFAQSAAKEILEFLPEDK